MAEFRRVLLDGYPTEVQREGDQLVAGDGRAVAIADAVHLAPVAPSKIICVHLNYSSRVDEFMTKLPAAPTYFHKPITSLTGHGSDVVRPEGCEWLNYEGEIAIRKMMYLSPSFDHRIIDGAVGARFTAALKHVLENPEALLLELV